MNKKKIIIAILIICIILLIGFIIYYCIKDNTYEISNKQLNETSLNEVQETIGNTIEQNVTNEVIAERFYWLEFPFIYRVHEAPDMEKINELNRFLFNLGYKIHANKDNIHPSSFSKVLEEVKGKPEEKVVSNLILRTLFIG